MFFSDFMLIKESCFQLVCIYVMIRIFLTFFLSSVLVYKNTSDIWNISISKTMLSLITNDCMLFFWERGRVHDLNGVSKVMDYIYNPYLCVVIRKGDTSLKVKLYKWVYLLNIKSFKLLFSEIKSKLCYAIFSLLTECIIS